MATLKKQLDEREKQLATEQEDASAAKNRLREMTKVRHFNLPITSSGPIKNSLLLSQRGV